MNLGGSKDPVADMVTSWAGCRESTRQLPRLDDGGSTLLNGCDELSIQPTKLVKQISASHNRQNKTETLVEILEG